MIYKSEFDVFAYDIWVRKTVSTIDNVFLWSSIALLSYASSAS